MATKYPGREAAIEELAELNAWLEAVDNCSTGFQARMDEAFSKYLMQYGILSDADVRELWEASSLGATYAAQVTDDDYKVQGVYFPEDIS
tara:strand:- start:1372 stop:1641 length:270 start_codon:yes stop_codon:yes gene_type:complete